MRFRSVIRERKEAASLKNWRRLKLMTEWRSMAAFAGNLAWHSRDYAPVDGDKRINLAGSRGGGGKMERKTTGNSGDSAPKRLKT